MKQQWYQSPITKAFLIAAEHILVAVMVGCILLLYCYPVMGSELLHGKPAEKYEDTAAFSTLIWEASNTVMDGIRNVDEFETDGNYDPQKIVDIETYRDTHSLSGEDEHGLAYRLEDLYQWAQEYYSTGEGGMIYNAAEERPAEAVDGDSEYYKIIVCKKPDGSYRYYSYEEFKNMIDSGELQFVVTEDESTSEDDLLAMLHSSELYEGNADRVGFRGLQSEDGKISYIDCWNYDGQVMKEKVPPLNAKSVMDVANNNPYWNGRLNEAYEMLSDAIFGIYDELSSYLNKEEYYQEGDTNLVYLYADQRNKRIYTNCEAFSDYANLENSIKSIQAMGKYAVIHPKLKDFDTNIQEIDEESWRNHIKFSGPNEDSFVYAVAVDTAYPIHDTFYNEAKLYQKYGGNAQILAVTAAVSGLFFLLILIWLTVIAGRSNRTQEVCLNWFDKIKTELAAVLVIGLWAGPMFLAIAVASDVFFPVVQNTMPYLFEGGQNGYDYVREAIPYIACIAVMAVYTCAWFLIGYLSLVRRIKRKTLWKNSVLRSVGRFVGKIYSHIQCVWRAILIFGVFLLLHWMLVITSGSYLFVVLVFGADLAAFVYLIYQAIGKQKIKKGIEKIAGGEVDYQISVEEFYGEQRVIAERINSIGEGLDSALEENMKSERLKTDLITNVSHDIKTPLTSIINYVELLKQENFEDPKIQRYLEVLEQKSQRLKTLTEDVVEASKVSSGNISLEYMNINFVEMIQQTSGEFAEKFQARDLQEILTLPDQELIIRADGRRMWRVTANIYNNAAKYALRGTRVYADLKAEDGWAVFNLKNISEQRLNISADELTERFIRGDISRSTEGSGLGLSIAKTLTEMQGGKFEIYVDGDLFRVTVSFPIC